MTASLNRRRGLVAVGGTVVLGVGLAVFSFVDPTNALSSSHRAGTISSQTNVSSFSAVNPPSQPTTTFPGSGTVRTSGSVGSPSNFAVANPMSGPTTTAVSASPSGTSAAPTTAVSASPSGTSAAPTTAVSASPSGSATTAPSNNAAPLISPVTVQVTHTGSYEVTAPLLGTIRGSFAVAFEHIGNVSVTGGLVTSTTSDGKPALAISFTVPNYTGTPSLIINVGPA